VVFISGHRSHGPKEWTPTVGPKLARVVFQESLKWGEARRSRWASLRHPGLVVGVLPADSSMGGGPIVRDCMLSTVGLEAGSDRWCGLLPSRLEVGRGGIGVVLPVLMSRSLVEVAPAYGEVVHAWSACASRGKDS